MHTPPVSIAVTIGDSDLTSERGQRILTLRIQRAARTICETQVLESLPNNMRRERACIREAQARAEAAVKTVERVKGSQKLAYLFKTEKEFIHAEFSWPPTGALNLLDACGKLGTVRFGFEGGNRQSDSGS